MMTALFEDWLKSGESYRPTLIRLLTDAAENPKPFCVATLEREYLMGYARACSLADILVNTGLVDQGEFGFDTPLYGAANHMPLRYRFSASPELLTEIARALKKEI